MIPVIHTIAALRRRIAARAARRRSTAALQARLEQVVTRQLRREVREDRAAARHRAAPRV